jgi:glyoxylase-like metal-dependent hydrolase (beta-lactamase superfamily II)
MADRPVRARRWRRRLALALLLACAAVATGALLYGRRAWDAILGRAPALEPRAMTVVPGIHMLGGLSPSPAYVVETAEGLILIDSGLDVDAGYLRSQMAELRLDWTRIRAIFLTHAHGDHIGGAEALRRATGARVHAGAGDAAVIRAGGPREAVFSTFSMPGQMTHSTQVDVELRGGERITIGGVEIAAIAAPGHTPGSVCYLVESRGRRALFGGDVIMMLKGDAPPLDEPDQPLGTYSAYLPPRYRGDARQTLATLRDLRRLPVPDLVLPGHPRSDPTPQSPSLSSRDWDATLVRGIRAMETLVARYEADGADFLDGNPRALLPDLDYLGDRGTRAVYAFSSGSRLFLVDAPGGPGLLDDVAARRRQLGRPPMVPTAVLLTACGSGETSGLRDLVDRCHPQVYAARAGLADIRRICPAGTIVRPADELAAACGLAVETIDLAGRGIAPIAYRLACGGKSVLFSGQIPVKLSDESGEHLVIDLLKPPGDLRGYFATLTRFHESPALAPDLWLPALPTHGQNANLYDRQWRREVERNLVLLRSIVAQSPSPSGR